MAIILICMDREDREENMGNGEFDKMLVFI